MQADSQVYIATKQKLENEMRETENAKEKLQHISAELKRKSSEVTRNKERVKKAQKVSINGTNMKAKFKKKSGNRTGWETDFNGREGITTISEDFQGEFLCGTAVSWYGR